MNRSTRPWATPPSSARRTRNGSPARQASSAACGVAAAAHALEHAERRAAAVGGERGRDVDAAERLEQVRRRRALAEQHDVVGPRQRGARHDRAGHAGRAQPVGEPVAGAQVVGDEVAGPQPVLGRLAEADPQQAAEVDPQRPGAVPDERELLGACAGPSAQELRPRPERVQAEVLRRRLLGHAVEAAGDAAGSVRSGRRQEASRNATTVTRTRCSASSPPPAAGRAAGRGRRAARAGSRRRARAAASRTRRRRPRA